MKTLKHKLTLLEKQFGVGSELPPTVFVHVTDASTPDPEGPALAGDYSDQAIIGARTARCGKDQVIERNPGEKVHAFKKRLSKTLPDQRLFFMRYLQEEGGPPH